MVVWGCWWSALHAVVLQAAVLVQAVLAAVLRWGLKCRMSLVMLERAEELRGFGAVGALVAVAAVRCDVGDGVNGAGVEGAARQGLVRCLHEELGARECW